MSGEIQKQFLVTSKIGNGNFSTVYLANHIQTQQIVAVKTMKNHIPIAIKQAQILKKMNHPNIIKLYKFEKSKHKEQALIVLEYVPQNILQLYESQQYGLKQDQVKCILFQSCMGLYHIHKKGIIHRDIKPENIMINRNKAEVKLIDFGLAIEQDQCITDYVATRWYRAPENLLGTKEYTVAIDIFSLGCVVVQLYLGNPLFPGANNIDQISKIFSMIEEPTMQTWRKGYEMLHKLGLNFNLRKERKKATLKTLLSSCSEGLAKIIQKMLILNPFKRITAEQILKDPYFKDIQKIIPPYVYDQYLADFKNTRTSMIKEIPRIEKRNESKERIRFLSEEKAFGAFSSFKPNNPLNKFQKQLTKEKQKNQLDKSGSSKKLSLEKIIKNCGSCDNNNDEMTVFRNSGVSSSIKNKIIKEPSNSIQQNQTTEIADASMNLKNSIEKYENNIMKLSTSLKNIKLLKSSSEINTQTNQNFIQHNEVTDQVKNVRSSQMLSFRGFNQPKQRVSIKQTGPTFLKKYPVVNEQKLDKFPIKNKKVMEYLQKFQTIANHSQQLQKQKLQNSRSEPIIYQSVNGSLKKQQILVTSGTKQFLSRQIPQKEQLQNSFTDSSLQLNLNENGSFEQIQSSSNLLSQQFKADYSQSNEGFNYIPNDMTGFVNARSQDLRRSFEIERSSNFQSPSRQSMQQPLIKFGSSSYDQQSIQTQFLPVQHSIYNSNTMTEDMHNMQMTSDRGSQTFLKEPKSLNTSNYLESSRTLINPIPSMNISSNRPIQNKIKLIAVRDNMPGNGYEIANQSQLQSSGLISSANVSRNPSYYKSSSNFMDRSRPNLGSQTSLQSPGKQAHYIHTSQQIYPSELQSKPNYIYLNQQKTKQFKSLQHRQFFSKKAPSNRYSVDISDDAANLGYPNNYAFLNQTTNRNEIKPNIQKNHQTTLSQLRQSITGLTQTLNQGAFLSNRSQKYNNKNININLNLNIYEKRGPSKR